MKLVPTGAESSVLAQIIHIALGVNAPLLVPKTLPKKSNPVLIPLFKQSPQYGEFCSLVSTEEVNI